MDICLGGSFRVSQSTATGSPSSISSQDSLVGMLGLRAACGYQEVVKAYNETLKLIHPDKCGLPGTDVAFMELHPAYTEWNTARVRHGWYPPPTPSSAPVNSESHRECQGDLGARPPLASQSRRPGVLSSEQVRNRLPRGPIPQTCLKTVAPIQHQHTITFFDISSPLSTPMIRLEHGLTLAL